MSKRGKACRAAARTTSKPGIFRSGSSWSSAFSGSPALPKRAVVPPARQGVAWPSRQMGAPGQTYDAIVDDDESACRALGRLLRAEGMLVPSSAARCRRIGELRPSLKGSSPRARHRSSLLSLQTAGERFMTNGLRHITHPRPGRGARAAGTHPVTSAVPATITCLEARRTAALPGGHVERGCS